METGQAFTKKAKKDEQTAYELLQNLKEDYKSLRRSISEGLYSHKSENLLNDLHPTLKGIISILEMLEKKIAEAED